MKLLCVGGVRGFPWARARERADEAKFACARARGGGLGAAEIRGKYPAWLETHADSLPAEVRPPPAATTTTQAYTHGGGCVSVLHSPPPPALLSGRQRELGD